MDELKGEIAETIKMPLFLLEWKSEHAQEVIEICYTILDLHYKGVKKHFLSDRSINRILYEIEVASLRLKEISTADINLLSWIWINEVVTKWIKIAISYDEFEVATNLRKIINFEYA